MKNTLYTAGMIVAVIIAVFVLAFQKQQHEHDEKMEDKFAGLDKQKHAQVIELAHVEESVSIKERIRDFFVSIPGFFVSLFR